MSYKIIQLKFIEKHSEYTVHNIIQFAMEQTIFLLKIKMTYENVWQNLYKCITNLQSIINLSIYM